MFRSNTPQLYMDIDRSKVRAMGVTIEDLNKTLQIYMGSLYVNNFNAFGRSWQVNIMADGAFPQSRGGHQLPQGAQYRKATWPP